MPSLQDISKSDVAEAIAKVIREGVPKGRGSTKFCLVASSAHLPPKYIVALAARRSLGRDLSPNEFTGGAQTNDLLAALGFTVTACGCGGTTSASPPKLEAKARRAPAVRPAPSRKTSPTIVRLVAKGQTPESAAGARNMLIDAVREIPRGAGAKFLLTPGGFVRTGWPKRFSPQTGWQSTTRDLKGVIAHAEEALTGIMNAKVFEAAEGKTEVITVGIDLFDEDSDLHSELVAIYRVRDRRLVGWTGKSYPTMSQEADLLQVVDLNTHFHELAGERVLVLGCHDLNMFSPRGWANQAPGGSRRERCHEMRTKVAAFKPTVVLQHPHSTDTPNIWRMPWLSLAKDVPSIRSWASGIAYFKWNGRPRAPLDRVLDLTKCDDGSVVDVVLNSKSYS